jgi:hypothetical protein
MIPASSTEPRRHSRPNFFGRLKSLMRVKGMAETLCACPPIQDAAKSLACGRTWCSGSAAAVGHSTYRHPIELSAAQGHRGVMQTFLAIDPGRAMALLKLPKGWAWPRRLPLGVRAAAATSQDRVWPGAEVGGFATHGTNVERRDKFLDAAPILPLTIG